MLRILILMSALTWGIHIGATVVVYGTNEVRLLIGSGGQGTVLRFPKPVSRIDNASLFHVKASKSGGNVDYRQIEVGPRVASGTQSVRVLLNDGSAVKLRLEISSSGRAQSFYNLESESVRQKDGRETAGTVGSDLEVLRTLLEKEVPSGLKQWSSGIPIKCRAKGLSARIVRQFDGNGLRGFQVEIKNDAVKSSYFVREESVQMGKIEMSKSPLIHVSSKTIEPRGKPKSSILMTILADEGVRSGNLKVCDLGEQVELVEQVRGKK